MDANLSFETRGLGFMPEGRWNAFWSEAKRAFNSLIQIIACDHDVPHSIRLDLKFSKDV